MKIRIIFIGFFIVALITSCGYLSSGIWENDDKNWSRAYGFPLPDSIKLINSWYWRSPHWTLEQAMFFEAKYNEGVKNSYILDTTIIELPYSDTIKISFFNDKPKWFLPKPYKFYNIWKGNRNEFDNFLLFMDKESGNLFWTDFQI